MSVDPVGFELPTDAPQRFQSLLAKWQNVFADHRPTKADLPFDKLVVDHPGLAYIRPVFEAIRLVDLGYDRVGPDYKKHMNFDPTGLTYADFVRQKLRERCLLVFGSSMESGLPHYWHVSNLVHGYASSDYERLLLPLYDADGDFDLFLIDCVWRSRINVPDAGS